MCNTIQYFFDCGHSATYRFRNKLCQLPKSRECRIIDTNRFIAGACSRCTKHGHTSRWSKFYPNVEFEDEFEEVWYVPSRCFVDVGFQNLNPFGSPENKDTTPISPPTKQPPQNPTSPTKTQSVWSQFGSQKDTGPGNGLVAKILTPQNISPCCKMETTYGAYEAVRLEDYEVRIEGRIMDSHCESMQ